MTSDLDLRGVWVPLITPFDAQGAVDVGAIERLCHEYSAAGVSGIVALGTTGEASALEPEEKRVAIDAVIRYVVAGEKAVFYPADRERSYWPGEEHRVRIQSMRAQVSDLALERNGFVLIREPTNVRNFYDEDEVKRVYQTHFSVLALVKDEQGSVVRKLSQDIPRQGPLDKLDAFKMGHFIYSQYAPLAPGRYTLETAVTDRNTGHISAKKSTILIPPASSIGTTLGNTEPATMPSWSDRRQKVSKSRPACCARQ